MQIDKPIAIAITTLAIILASFFLAVPQYNNFRKLEQSLATKKAEYAARYDYYSGITKIYYDIQSRAGEIKKIDDAIPQGRDYGRLVYYFQKKAIESGLSVKSLFLSKTGAQAQKQQANKAAATVTMNDISFSAIISGDYESLGNFISNLERSSRMFEVTNISFGSDSSASATANPLMQFQGNKTYNFSMQILCHSY